MRIILINKLILVDSTEKKSWIHKHKLMMINS